MGSTKRIPTRNSSNPTLTAVPGLAVGHASDQEAATGCTVILGPFRAAVDVRGLASGTRQLDSLAANHLADRVDALLLTGGSAYGLAAADGVAMWLEEQGRGFETDAGRIAIVPSAVIFDLGTGKSDVRPDAAMG
ncbi:MAG: peptidase S58, partial [Gemmatimonas sp. SG8_38_2]